MEQWEEIYWLVWTIILGLIFISICIVEIKNYRNNKKRLNELLEKDNLTHRECVELYLYE